MGRRAKEINAEGRGKDGGDKEEAGNKAGASVRRPNEGATSGAFSPDQPGGEVQLSYEP